MPEILAQATVKAPIDRVWSAVIDVTSWPEWQTTHIALPDGPPAGLVEGQVFREKVKAAGFTQTLSWTVVEMIPNQSLKLTARAPMRTEISAAWELESAEADTVVISRSSFTGPLVPKDLGPGADATAIASLERLKTLLASATHP